MKHTVVISDVHLCEAVPGDALWMRYRQKKYFPHDEINAVLEHLLEEAKGHELTLVFNGDLFDFDAPPVVQGEVVFSDPPRSEQVAIDMLAKILDDHQAFVEALARVLLAGHRIVFISGNHDAQLAWPRVRDLLNERLCDAAAQIAGAQVSSHLVEQILHRAWFYHEDGIHIEHGNQYDHFCSFRYPMEPFTDCGQLVQPTMGSLSYRHLVSRMGYFNPHVDSSFMLSLPDYVSHWARYYVRSQHSLALAWVSGAVKVMNEIIRHQTQHAPERSERDILQARTETGVPQQRLVEHSKLFASPASVFPAFRELWLDRLAAAGAVGIATALGATFGGPLGAMKLGVTAAGALAAYEYTIPKPTLDDTYEKVMESARRVAKIHSARAVIFGHTHSPSGSWEDGVFFGNTGTWSAAYRDIACTIPKDNGKPVIWLRDDNSGELHGGLYMWRSGHLVVHQPIVEKALPWAQPAALPT